MAALMVPVAAPSRLAARPAPRASRSSRRATRGLVAAATVDAAAASSAPSRPPPPQWTPAPLPGSLPELLSLATSPAVLGADAQSAQYWAYALGRGAFFTAQAVLASAVTTGALGAFTQRLERQAATVAPPNGGAGLDWNAGDARGLAGLLASQAELYRRELEHIKNGVYRAPYDSDPRHRQFNPAYIADKAARLLRASGETAARRDAPGGGTEVLRTATDAAVETGLQPGAPEVTYPAYYLQNYHWQSDGWMSAKSAAAYENQTETLFQGCQDAMQRAALVPLSRYLASRDPAATSLLEVAAGTGRFHTFIKDNWPQLRTTCSELSPYYLAAARENMEYFQTEFEPAVNPGRTMARTAFVQCAAEALPFDDASFDVLMNVYLFHELPQTARVAAAAEFARVTRPGGLCVINDSLQRGDRAEMDAVMPRFSELYHEPWHLEYTETDMVALFDAAGFDCVDIQLAHVSKVWAFIRRSS